MNRISILLVIGLAVLMLGVHGCFQVNEPQSVIVEPCIALAGSDVDPCGRNPLWDIVTGVSASYTENSLPRLPFSILEEIRRVSNRDKTHGIYSPQFFVRGTFVPDSSRCVKDDVVIMVANDRSLITWDLASEAHSRITFNCYIDVKVREYLNGRGPDRVPIDIWHYTVSRENLTDDFAERLARSTPMSWMEGREMLMPLVRPNDISNGAWELQSFQSLWDVQRRSDGEIVVVGGWASIDHRFDYEFGIGEFTTSIKEAMASVKAENGGRVGNSQGDLPFADDANLGSLLENLRLYGAYSVADVTPVSAPRVPGDTDPDPYGLLVSDAAETAVPEVHGGLEGTATPVSALGDEPTATATVEPTATEDAEPTATATVEPTATPEAASTSEQS